MSPQEGEMDHGEVPDITQLRGEFLYLSQCIVELSLPTTRQRFNADANMYEGSVIMYGLLTIPLFDEVRDRMIAALFARLEAISQQVRDL